MIDDSLLHDDNFIRSVFDAIPSILLLADDDVRVLRLNMAASRLLGVGIDDIYRQRGGDVLHCIHATDVPDGCGHSEHCKECVIRGSVRKSFSGLAVFQQKTKMELVKADGTIIQKYFLVTTSPFKYADKAYALLILEDISELEELKGFIQICSSCKNIWNEEGRWEQFELYLREHSNASFTHGICPDCFKKLYPDFCKVQCWEFMKCGREADKSCPVVLTDCGRRCWTVASTLCGGKTEGKSFGSFRKCRDCDFFIRLHKGDF